MLLPKTIPTVGFKTVFHSSATRLVRGYIFVWSNRETWASPSTLNRFYHKSSSENHYLRSSINHWESLYPGSSIESQTLKILIESHFTHNHQIKSYPSRIITRVALTRIIYLRSFINHWESLYPRSSIKSHSLKVITRVTLPRIIYCKLFTKNHHENYPNQDHQIASYILFKSHLNHDHHIDWHLQESPMQNYLSTIENHLNQNHQIDSAT